MKAKPTIAAPIAVCAVLILTLIFSILPASAIGLDENPYMTTVVLQLVIYMLPSLFFCTLRGGEYRHSLRLTRPRAASGVFMLCALVVMLCGSCVIEYFMSRVSPVTMAETATATSAGYAMNKGFFDGLYLVLAFAVLPAMTEEFLFRGIILAEYSPLGIFCAVFMSSTMFAACHLSLVRFPIYFFCGVVLSLTAYAARSVVAPMILHTVYNVFVLFFEQHVLSVAEKQNISGVLLLIVAMGCTILFSAVMCFEAAGLYRGYADDNAPSDYAPSAKTNTFVSLAVSVFSPSFIVLAVIYIIAVFAGN